VAKLKAPLLSLGAAGAIGKSLVFFNWKGLDVVREYVIPANPKTDPQTTQRGYLTDAVATIHQYQALLANFFGPGDTTAYALLGSTRPTPRTWFNEAVKSWVDLKVLGKIPAIFGNGSLSPGDTTLTMVLGHLPEWTAITDGKLWYGTSKTALIYSIDTTVADLLTGKTITGLTNGVKYFVQFRSTLPDTFDGNRSGIYYGTPKVP